MAATVAATPVASAATSPATQKRRSAKDAPNSLQRMLQLEKQRILSQLSADPTMNNNGLHPSSPTATNSADAASSPATPSSRSRSSSIIEPLLVRARPTVSRRHRAPESKPATTKSRNPVDPKAVGNNSSPALAPQQHPYKLPPIVTDTGSNSLVSELLASFPPTSDDMADSRPRPRRPVSVAGERALAPLTTHTRPPVPKNVVAGQQSSAPPPAPPPPQLGAASRSASSAYLMPPKVEVREPRTKENMEKEQEGRGRKRRLSKPPPPGVVAVSQQTSTASLDEPLRQPRSKKYGKYPPQSHKSFTPSQTESSTWSSSRSRTRQQNDRPSSFAASSNADVAPRSAINPSPAPSRGRSSSLSSLIRSSLDRRRSSVDKSSDSSFIGGIKLEQQQLDAHQRMLNEQVIGPEADIHPALREPRTKRSVSPFQLFTKRSEPREPHSRAYPPIAIRTSARSQGLVAPERPTTSDSGMQGKWRTRLGLRSSMSMERPGQKLTKPPSQPREEKSRRFSWGRHGSTPVISSPTVIGDYRNPIDDEKTALHTRVDHGAHPALVDRPERRAVPKKKKPPVKREEVPQVAEIADGNNSGSDRSSSPSYKTAPSSPSPPPTPPRRSSKRKSLVQIEAGTTRTSMSTLSSPGNGNKKDDPKARTLPTSPPVAIHQNPSADRRESSQSSPPSRKTASNPPSIPYDSLATDNTSQASRLSLVEAARAVFGRLPSTDATPPQTRQENRPKTTPSGKMDTSELRRRSVSPPSIHPVSGASSKPARVLGMDEWDMDMPSPISPHARSSEDSFSDEFKTPTEQGTPDTSRPQSEKDLSPRSGKDESEMVYHSGYTSVLPSPAFSYLDESFNVRQPSPFELDPIQAAAMKVLAAFPEASHRRQGHDLQHSSTASGAQSNTRRTPDSQSHSPAGVSQPHPDWPLPSAGTCHGDSTRKPQLEIQTSEMFGAPKPLRLPSQRKPMAASTVEQMVKESRRPYTPSIDEDQDDEATAKRFVECCGCKYYHDIPIKLYEAMAHLEGMVSMEDKMDFLGSVSMTVRCPWCKHDMNTKCCSTVSAVVRVQEKLR